MRIDSVDLFYVAMPTILDIGDGSQDALLVRVQADGFVGWGECEASPLTSIASLIAPMSHSACKPVGANLLGATITDPADIRALGERVRWDSFDLLQAAHTWSGIDIALWDLLGKQREVPVHELLGPEPAQPKLPYASVLFGQDPEQTLSIAKEAAASGFAAVKFGWSDFGRGTVAEDIEQLAAAREGIGEDVEFMVDAAMAWGDDAVSASKRMKSLHDFRVLFLEEPFVPGATRAYRELALSKGRVGIAAGEGSSSYEAAISMIDDAGVDYVQVDAGRVGGITEAFRVASYAARAGVSYINHTFTTHLALSASLQPFAFDANSGWCEYPLMPSSLAQALTIDGVPVGADGRVRIPEAPGLGVTISEEAIRSHLVDVEISVDGTRLFSSPRL
ncbi:mandelate racemase/muconate lactonizing enzyme family protein [Herbiconiux sp. A18JL235]|uniref:Mandelate racemase/muconate lactonizing enzyme family protein n=1 Tax=Herbiconiux sp. A18JL235 TaxID=3152363 RepID=A0AB39BH37_9MICO